MVNKEFELKYKKLKAKAELTLKKIKEHKAKEAFEYER